MRLTKLLHMHVASFWVQNCATILPAYGSGVRTLSDCDWTWQWLSEGKMKPVVISTHAALKWLFWLSQTIHLMGTQSAAVASRITTKSQEVKARLPLNLKNMSEGSAVCRPVCFLFMQSVKCVCVYSSLHVPQCIMRRQTGEVKNDCDPVYWVEWRQTASTHSCVCMSVAKHGSQQKWVDMSEHVPPLMNVFTKYPGLRLIPNIDWSHNAMRAG